MKIFVTGGTGFIGSRLLVDLAAQGHDIVLLVRPSEAERVFGSTLEVVVGDSTKPGPWQERVKVCDGAINLAGTPIAGRWTNAKKREIRESRIFTTKNLVDAIPTDREFTLLSTSAVGVYGDQGETLLDENAQLGNDFLAGVAREWEAEALKAEAKGARVALTRFAIVFDKNGGALKELDKVTRMMLGGPIGEGKQWFSWIHREDLVRALCFVLGNKNITGPVNLCAPNPIRQGDLAHMLGHKLGKPSSLKAPPFAVRLVLGEFADTLLFSQRMHPAKLLESGFVFLFPTLEEALDQIYSS